MIFWTYEIGIPGRTILKPNLIMHTEKQIVGTQRNKSRIKYSKSRHVIQLVDCTLLSLLCYHSIFPDLWFFNLIEKMFALFVV